MANEDKQHLLLQGPCDDKQTFLVYLSPNSQLIYGSSTKKSYRPVAKPVGEIHLHQTFFDQV